MAGATVTPLSEDFESGLGSLSYSTATGSFSLVGGGYGDATSVRAAYNGGGANGYSRFQWGINWQEGDDVWYSAAYYLPTGFKNAMQGQTALLRWDDWPSHPNDRSDGGIVIWGGDKKARLVRELLPSGTVNVLSTPFDIPEGRWFWLEVHQHLSSAGGALNEVYLDGTLIDRTTGPNTYSGRTIERIRYGLDAIADTAQTNPLSLQLDRPRVSTSQVGPNPALAQPVTPPTSSTPPPPPRPAPTPVPVPPSSSGTITTISGSSGSGAPPKRTKPAKVRRTVTPRVRKCVRAARKRAARRGTRVRTARARARAKQRCVARYGRVKAARHHR